LFATAKAALDPIEDVVDFSQHWQKPEKKRKKGESYYTLLSDYNQSVFSTSPLLSLPILQLQD
jgi:hypothetical protein